MTSNEPWERRLYLSWERLLLLYIGESVPLEKQVLQTYQLLSLSYQEVKVSENMVGLELSWMGCLPNVRVKKGKELNLRVYQFLKQPLIDRFGAEWYKSLEEAVAELKAKGYIK